MVDSEKTSKKILLLVPDGTGIKNYLYSKVFQDCDSLLLFHNFDDDTLAQIQKNIRLKETIEIPKYKESVREKFYRELIHTVRIRHYAKKAENPTILKFRKRKHKGWKLKLFYAGVGFASRLVFKYDQILQLEAKYDASIKRNPFYEQVKAILEKHDIDTVFCTHQRALKAPTVFAAARDLGIKATTVIYSWDNLPKARLALRADNYLVWSKHMQEELHFFYPEIPLDRILVTGTPQFEFYLERSNVLAREAFYAKHGLDPNKRILCFSGDDVATSPHDPQYLYDIAQALTEAGMEDELQIAFRRCPVDVSGRYDAVIKKFPELIIDIPPVWNFNSEIWTAVYPTYEDIKLLSSLAYYSDAVINVGSTMAFDFGMYDKPCIFINYDAVRDPEWTVDFIYKYQHFRSMPSPESVRWLNDKSKIVSVIREALHNPKTEVRSWFDIVVNHPDTASENILNAL